MPQFIDLVTNSEGVGDNVLLTLLETRLHLRVVSGPWEPMVTACRDVKALVSGLLACLPIHDLLSAPTLATHMEPAVEATTGPVDLDLFTTVIALGDVLLGPVGLSKLSHGGDTTCCRFAGQVLDQHPMGR